MKKLFSKADAVLIAVLLLIAAAALFFRMRGSAGEERFARIEKDGETISYFRLSEDLPYREYEIGGAVPVTIAAENGAVWFLHSECPDRLCVRFGKLSKTGETAVCLPARVAVTVEGEKKAVDAVTG